MDKKTKLKGFTLVELIVVMAIFGILMAAVMQVITPLNKISKRASIQEANAAAVDNVKSYLESSLRYAECVEVCVGGLTDNSGNNLTKYSEDELAKKFGVTTIGSSGSSLTKEQAAVVNFLDNHYSNRTEPSLAQDVKPLTGKVRMLKIDNANGGKITEYIYDFTAGYTYTNYLDKDTKIGDVEYEKGDPSPIPGRVNAKLTTKVNGASIINDVYYENYAFYIAPGYAQMQTIDKKDKVPGTDVNKLKGFDFDDDTSDDYYAALEPVDKTAVNFSSDLFSLSVVTYKNDKNADDKYTYRGTCDETGTEKYTAFQSPFALSNANMSLVNINSQYGVDKWAVDSYGPVRLNGTDKSGKTYKPDQKVSDDGASGWKYAAINSLQAPKINAADRLFVHPEITGTDSDDCIYFIYTAPDFK